MLGQLKFPRERHGFSARTSVYSSTVWRHGIAGNNRLTVDDEARERQGQSERRRETKTKETDMIPVAQTDTLERVMIAHSLTL